MRTMAAAGVPASAASAPALAAGALAPAARRRTQITLGSVTGGSDLLSAAAGKERAGASQCSGTAERAAPLAGDAAADGQGSVIEKTVQRRVEVVPGSK